MKTIATKKTADPADRRPLDPVVSREGIAGDRNSMDVNESCNGVDRSTTTTTDASALLDRAELASFLTERLASDGVVFLCRLPISGGGNNCRRFTTVKEAIAWVETHVRNYNIYVVNNPPPSTWDPGNARPERGGDGNNPSDMDIEDRRRFQLDFDPLQNVELLDAKAEANALLTSFAAWARKRFAGDHQPEEIGITTVVDSGRGIHAHIELKHFVKSTPMVTAVNEAMIEWFRARSKLTKPDGVANPSRIMRCPGATNHRTGTIARVILRQPNAKAHFGTWAQVLSNTDAATENAIKISASHAPSLDPGALDRRFDDIIRKNRERLAPRNIKLLRELHSIEFESIDKSLSPQRCGLSKMAITQAEFCVKSPDDVVEGDDGRPIRRPDIGYSNSEPMIAFAGQALREQATVADICAMLANPNLAISRHVYKPEHSDAGQKSRAIVRAVAEAICTSEFGPDVIVPAGFAPFSEDHLAEVFAVEFSPHLRRVNEWGQWLEWNKSRWVRDDTLQVFDLARQVCHEAAIIAPPKIKRAIASAASVAAVERLARSDRRIARPASQFDARADLLNTPDGVVDLVTGELLSHDPELYCTKQTSIGPDATGTRPDLWIRFLNDVTDGDAEYIGYLQRKCGYMLTGDTREHALFFAWGPGGNGKSVYVNTLRFVMGDYATSTPVETLTVSNHPQHPTDLADLRGARLVTAQETEEGRHWAESKIKMMTGGDRIKARFMRQDFFEYVPQFKLLIAGNHRPGLNAVDEAIRRRFHLLPFTVTISESKKDKELEVKLRAEAPAILRWMIEGCLQWRSEGLRPPNCVAEATRDYLDGEDNVGQWLCDCTVPDINGQPLVADIFESWGYWCQQNNLRKGTSTWLGDQLEARGFTRRKSNGRRVMGLMFRPEERLRLEAVRNARDEHRRLEKAALNRLGCEVIVHPIDDQQSPF